MISLQSEFDAVVKHLYTQRRPSSKDGGCYYRIKVKINGELTCLSCAVGCRIPDDVYRPSMDTMNCDGGSSIHSIIERFPTSLPAHFYQSEYKELYSDLQLIHDRCEVDENGEFCFEELSHKLKKIAGKYELKFIEPSV